MGRVITAARVYSFNLIATKAINIIFLSHDYKKLEIMGPKLPANTLDELIDELGGPSHVAEVREGWHGEVGL